jgi:hypothetical protein
MFDLDGNGTISRDEFQKVMTIMRTHTPMGALQRKDVSAVWCVCARALSRFA